MTYRELTAGLIWPRLLAASRLALRPARLGLAMVMLVLIGLIGQIPTLWGGAGEHYTGPLDMGSELARSALRNIGYGVTQLTHERVGEGLLDLFVEMPRKIILEYPWGSLAVFVPALLVWTIGGGAIARTAATEFSLDRRTGWTRGLGFSLSRWGSLFSSMAAPLVVVGVFVGIMALAGYAMLAARYANVLGAGFFFLVLIAGSAAIIILVAFMLGMPMLVPSVACEGTDAIDGVQRCYAYVSGRPLRLVLYGAVLLVQAVVVTLVLGSLAQAAVSLSVWSSTLLLPETYRDALRAQVDGRPFLGEELSDTARTAVHIVRFWVQVPMLLVAGYVVSFWFSGGTVLYLLIRQVCDGQDPGELWTPGLIAGTHVMPEEAQAAGDDDEE